MRRICWRGHGHVFAVSIAVAAACNFVQTGAVAEPLNGIRMASLKRVVEALAVNTGLKGIVFEEPLATGNFFAGLAGGAYKNRFDEIVGARCALSLISS